MLDPRSRNVFEQVDSVDQFVGWYADSLASALRNLDLAHVKEALRILESAAQADSRILSIGNGGSAAIAEHLCCDLTKGTHTQAFNPLRTHSLTAPIPIYSALANDFGFDAVFSTQIEYFGREGDILIAISSSGNSPNIIRAVEAAQAKGMKVIGLSGFSGGQLAEKADVSLHVTVSNYGIVEDAHQALFHIFAQVIAGRREGRFVW